MAAPRTAVVERFTKETKVQLSLSIDGGPLDLLPDSHSAFKSSSIPDQNTEHHATQSSASQQIWVWTGIGFLDHMLHGLAKHGGWSLRIRTAGDLASEYSLSITIHLFFLFCFTTNHLPSRRPPHYRRHIPRPRTSLLRRPR